MKFCNLIFTSTFECLSLNLLKYILESKQIVEKEQNTLNATHCHCVYNVIGYDKEVKDA